MIFGGSVRDITVIEDQRRMCFLLLATMRMAAHFPLEGPFQSHRSVHLQMH